MLLPFRRKKKKKILVVDDDLELRLLLCKILRGLGYDVLEAVNGRLALEVALQHKPDLIIMDIMMPEMSGLDSVQYIRSNPRVKHIPIVMLTAKNKIADLETSLNAGANDYLAKPFEIPQLASKIARLLKNSAP